MLHTITLSVSNVVVMAHPRLTRSNRSLSLKSNASQDKILFELEQLKYSFKEALRLSLRSTVSRSPGQGDNADARVSRNLHKLAAAARQFHSAASSTSGTTRYGSSNVSWRALSLFGDFPEHKQQRVRDFIDHQLHYTGSVSACSGRDTPVRVVSPPPSPSAVPKPLATSHPVAAVSPLLETAQAAVVDDVDEDEDDESDDEQEYFDGLQELARDRMVRRDYPKAIDFLTQAMARDVGATSTGNEFRDLQILLALCHFLQGNWKSAEPIVASLSRTLDEMTCNLLHALALSHLFEYSFDEALKTCRKSMSGKKKLLKASTPGLGAYPESDFSETVALFATIYHMRGDPIHAEIYHRRLPGNFKYKHPTRVIDYIYQHSRVLPILLGIDAVVPSSNDSGYSEDDNGPFTDQPVEMPCAEYLKARALCRKPTVLESPLRTRFAFFERYESDTSKLVVEQEEDAASPTDSGIAMDADDEESAKPQDDAQDETQHVDESQHEIAPVPRSVPKRRLTRMFTSRRPQGRATDVRPVDADATSPESPALPASRWNMFAFASPKKLLRKKSTGFSSPETEFPTTTRRSKTLRLGAMELTLRRSRAPNRPRNMVGWRGMPASGKAGGLGGSSSDEWLFTPYWKPCHYAASIADEHCVQTYQENPYALPMQPYPGDPASLAGRGASVYPHSVFEFPASPIDTSKCNDGSTIVASEQPVQSSSSEESDATRSELLVLERPSELSTTEILPARDVGEYIRSKIDAYKQQRHYEDPIRFDPSGVAAAVQYKPYRPCQGGGSCRCDLRDTERPTEPCDVMSSFAGLLSTCTSGQLGTRDERVSHPEPHALTTGDVVAVAPLRRLPDIAEESPAAEDRSTSTPKPAAHKMSSDDLWSLIRRMAGALASLPGPEDPAKQRAARSELVTISGLLVGISNDAVLAKDLKRIISSLDVDEGASGDDASDSGYESGSPRSRPAPKLVIPARGSPVAEAVPSVVSVDLQQKHQGPKIDLEVIRGLLDGISGESVLVSDLRRILVSLDARREMSPRSAVGSPTQATEEPAPTERSAIRTMSGGGSAQEGCAAPALLRAMPSFVAGDDAKFMYRRLDEPAAGDDDESEEKRVSAVGEEIETGNDGGSVVVETTGLCRALSFVAGLEDRLPVPGEADQQKAASLSGEEEGEPGIGDGLQAGLEEPGEAVEPVVKKQVVWALEDEEASSLGGELRRFEEGKKGMRSALAWIRKIRVGGRGSFRLK